MKKIWNSILVLAATGILVLACSKNKDDDTPPAETKIPEITNFTPLTQEVGKTVTINGKNFATTTSGNVVQFNGVNASLNSATATQLVAVVPSGDVDGKIKVTVGTETATSTQDFTLKVSSITLNMQEVELFRAGTAELIIENLDGFQNPNVSFESNNTDVATVNEEGVITGVEVGETTVTVSVNDFTANCIVKINPDVYAVGNTDGYAYAMLWKNGEPTKLTATGEGTNSAESVYVTVDGNVFVAGNEDSTAKIWRNGEVLYTLEDSKAEINDVFVDTEGDVYGAGKIQVNNIWTAVVWRNGTILYQLNGGIGDADAKEVYVVGEHVYTVGYEFDPEIELDVAKTWLNENLLYTSNGGGDHSVATSVIEIDNYIFTCGKDYDPEIGYDVAFVRKDGEMHFSLSDGNGNSRANEIDIDMNTGLIYTAGHQDKEGNAHATIWENGNVLYSFNSGNGSSYANSVKKFGDDLYYGGEDYNEDGVYEGKVFKNGELLYSFISEVENEYTEVYDIFIK